MELTLRELVETIQRKKKLTIEQVASRIDYSRVHLSRAMKSNNNPEIRKALIHEFPEVLQNDTLDDTQNDRVTDKLPLVVDPLTSLIYATRENSQANQLHAQANYLQAKARLVEAENTKKLIDQIAKPTGGGPADNGSIVLAKMDAFQELVVGHLTRLVPGLSVEEFDHALGNKLSEKLQAS
jgi:hypothetical protein